MPIKKQGPLTPAQAQRHDEWVDFLVADFRDFVRTNAAGRFAEERGADPRLLEALALGDRQATESAEPPELARARDVYRMLHESWVIAKLASLSMIAEGNAG